MTRDEAFEALYRAADEAFEERWNFPTDLSAGRSYIDAMTRLGELLIEFAEHMPEPSWLADTPKERG